MAPESVPAGFHEEWGVLPRTAETAAGLAAFTSTRVERILGIVVGSGSTMMGAQAFVAALGPSEDSPGWHLGLSLAIFVPLAIMIFACAIGRGVLLWTSIFAVLFPVCLALWPLATVGSQPEPTGFPWIYYLVNVGTVAAVFAFSVPWKIAMTIFVPIEYGIVRMIQAGFAPEFWVPTLLAVSFSLIFGGVLYTIGWVFRSVAVSVDTARMRAVASYAAAAAADAAEKERVAVAALMHDSVLAALIAAERAESPRERALAVSMAREALTRLANAEQDAGEGPDEPLTLAELGEQVHRVTVDLGLDVDVEMSMPADAPPIPGRVARALALAASQAIANAVEHAGGVGLAIHLTASEHVPSATITVRDRGAGFDQDTVPDDRLGIRASIFARVAAVGGHAEITSDAGGTTVLMQWQVVE